MIENSDPKSHPLGNIVRNFNIPASQSRESNQQITEEHAEQTGISLMLSANTFPNPAFLLDKNLCITWQNQRVWDDLWHFAPGNQEQRLPIMIFDLLFDVRFQNKVINWRQWVRFFFQHAIGILSSDKLENLIEDIKAPHKAMLHDMLKDQNPPFSRAIFSGRLRQVMAMDALASFWVIATDFQEGRLFLFDSVHPIIEEQGIAKAADIEQKLELVRMSPHPAIQSPVHILAACLHNAETIRTEMLAEEYSRLVSRLWQKTIEVLENFGGIVAQNKDNGLLCYFIPGHSGEKNPLYIIECALQLKSEMVELGREWKIRKGWLHDIELNIGIHSGEEYMGLVRSSLGDTLTLYGESLQLAGHLAQMGSHGQIWTTKALVNKLPPEKLKQLRFGVFRLDNNRQVFISKCFSRIRDLTGLSAIPSEWVGDNDMGSVAVTQIFDLQP